MSSSPPAAAPAADRPVDAAPRTDAKSAMQLAVGDVIVAPDRSLHTVTEWESFPHIAVCFRTDTGHDINVAWIDATTVLAYDVISGQKNTEDARERMTPTPTDVADTDSAGADSPTRGAADRSACADELVVEPGR